MKMQHSEALSPRSQEGGDSILRTQRDAGKPALTGNEFPPKYLTVGPSKLPWALLNSPGSGENMSPWLAVLESVSRLRGSNQSRNETPSSVRMQSGGESEPATLSGTGHWPPGYLTRPEPRTLGLCSATRDDQDFFMKRSKVIFHLQEQKIRIIVQGTNSDI